MPYTDRRRFAALSVAGLLAVGAGAVASAQSGIDVALGPGMGSAQVRGLTAGSATIAAAAAPTDGGPPVALVSLRDVHVRSGCIKLRSLRVPMVGRVAMVIDLPEGSDVRADTFVIDTPSLTGDLGVGGIDLVTGTGAGASAVGADRAPGADRTDVTGAGLGVRELRSETLDVELAGLHSENLRTSKAGLRVVTGDTAC